MQHSAFFCFSKRKRARGDFDFPRVPLNRPRKPLRFSWFFPAKLEAAQKLRRCSCRRCRVAAHIGPYRTSANPYCSAEFKRKANLPQLFKRSCSQIFCPTTGGAYHSTRRVTWCVRSNYIYRYLLKLHPQDAPNRNQAPLFSPFISGKAEKNGPPEARRKRP